MNYSTAILIMNDNARCVKVTYEMDTEHTKADREMFKTFDKSIEVGQYVVVPTNTRHNLTVCKVVEVDVDEWIDTQKNLQWIVGRVDIEDAAKIKVQEEQAVVAIKHAEKLKRRKELKASMNEALNGELENVKLLPIISMGEEQTPAEDKVA